MNLRKVFTFAIQSDIQFLIPFYLSVCVCVALPLFGFIWIKGFNKYNSFRLPLHFREFHSHTPVLSLYLSLVHRFVDLPIIKFQGNQEKYEWFLLKSSKMQKKINCSMVFVFRFVFVIFSLWKWSKSMNKKKKETKKERLKDEKKKKKGEAKWCVSCAEHSNTLISTKSFPIWSYVHGYTYHTS